MRILFVEDQRMFAEMVAGQFLAGHDVAFADSVAAARVALEGCAGYEAVLIDYDLPDGKGTEVVQALRGARYAGKIIAVSAKDEGNAELRRAGAHAICKKAELHRVAMLLRGRGAR
jgi:DNA-binding response OmpR family regulator